MTFYINGTQVNVLTAPTIRETLDETLDSGTLTLVFSDIDTCYSPMSDLIIIDNENNTYSFLISSDSVSLISKEPLRYQHDLTIIQNTRQLSKTQVRNTVFTQPAKPIFSCCYNATLNNNSTTNYMTFLTEYGLGYFSNIATIPNKYNVKNAYVLVELTEIYGSKTTTSVSKQTGIVIPSISFDLYNGDTLVNSYSFDNVANGSKLYVDSSVLGSNSKYSIKNVSVGKTTLNTTGDIDYYVINLTYNVETYIYTMYDILDILRKQIAKNEYEAISNVFSPTIVITKTYVPSSGNYQVSFTLKNNNSQSATIHYNAYGSLTGSGSISLSGSATSQSIVLGAISSGSGYINAYTTIGSVNSTTTTETYTIYGISAPTLNWLFNATYGYQYNFVNTNGINGTLYYKVYKEGSTIADYSTQALNANGGSFTSAGYFNNCRMFYDYYFVSSDNRQSDVITGSIVLGTIPTLTAPTFNGDIGITKNSTTYTLTASITNPNNVSCKLYTRSTNSTFVSETILPNETLTITKSELISSGSNGYIYAYLTSDNYNNSETTSKYWSSTTNYNLTIYTYLDNVLDTSSTRTISVASGTLVYASNYASEIGGYIYDSGVPYSQTMTSDKSFDLYYVSAVYYTCTTYLSSNGIDGTYATKDTLSVKESVNTTLSLLNQAIIQQNQEYQSYSFNEAKSSISGQTAKMYYYTSSLSPLTAPTYTSFTKTYDSGTDVTLIDFILHNSNGVLVNYSVSGTIGGASVDTSGQISANSQVTVSMTIRGDYSADTFSGTATISASGYTDNSVSIYER